MNVVYLVIVVNVYILLTRSFMMSQDEFRLANLANQKTIGLKQLQVTGHRRQYKGEMQQFQGLVNLINRIIVNKILPFSLCTVFRVSNAMITFRRTFKS